MVTGLSLTLALALDTLACPLPLTFALYSTYPSPFPAITCMVSFMHIYT